MEQKAHGKWLHYLPILSIFLFWFQGAFLSSLLVSRPYIKLIGVFSLPAVACMVLAALRVYREQKLKEIDDSSKGQKMERTYP
jgi:hypothetical protein